MDEIVSFGEWLQKRRNQLGLTRAGLARQVGCSTITIKKIERDERRPSIQIAELLAEHLQIPTADREDFIRRARGEFVERFGAPTEISLADEPAEVDSSHKHNLPPQTTPFIGREIEIEEIVADLANPSCRLLTIIGVGGMGKTRLGIEVAKAQLGQFSDGIVYVPLAPVQGNSIESSLAAPLAALTDALGITLQGSGSPTTQIHGYLRQKELLIVFDNFEHLLDSAETLSPLLANAPDIKLLVTSRERLDLQEEWLYPLQGLAYQLGGTAVELFVQRARQVNRRFDPQLEASAMQQICELVEGMPLGLELAASWASQLSCTEILVEVKQEIDFLETTMRNVPARHRSLRAVFAHSWQRLTEAEQQILMNVAVFRGGFEREAATAVAEATLRQLSTLVNKSLLHRNQAGRYEMHELLRQFAKEKSKAIVDFEIGSQAKHGIYYLTLLAEQRRFTLGEYVGDPTLSAMPAITRDIDNFRAAWLWGLEHQHFQLLLDASKPLFVFYEDKGWIIEATEVSQLTINSTQPICNQDSLSIAAEEGLLACQLLAHHQGSLSWFQGRLGNYEQAIEIAQATLPFCAQIKDTEWAHYYCLLTLGNTSIYQGNSEDAIAASQALMTLSETMETYSHVIGLDFHADLLHLAGDYIAAQQVADLSSNLADKVNSLKAAALNRRNMAKIAAALGDYQRSAAYSKQGIVVAEKASERIQYSHILTEYGNTLRLLGDSDASAAYLEQALALTTEMNLVIGVANALWGLGNLAAEQGEYAAAKNYFRRSEQAASLKLWPAGGRGWVDLAENNVAGAN